MIDVTERWRSERVTAFVEADVTALQFADATRSSFSRRGCDLESAD